ncbi:MAG: tRNA pseudouridine(55) synthase TruB [Betaproteobacteria bacterium]|nr:tRNA pseudouridine(55) synthase TruB [Betaproteobacteria bacterium]
MQNKRRWQRIDGLLLLDKPSGITSNDALQKARRLVNAAKAGHTGTLDPLASGLLPLCFGEATKFSADLLDADKSYEATLRFGIVTATGDSEGEIIETRPVTHTPADLTALLPRFTGALRQTPPMYSALKHQGKPLYELARQGIEIERAPREITIHKLKLLDADAISARIFVTCSKGAYIRTLAEDIGAALGCGAHLIALRRTGVGALDLERAWTLEALAALPESERAQALLPLDTLLSSLPNIELDAEATKRFAHGNPVSLPASGASAEKYRVYHDSRLLGIGERDAQNRLWPKRLIASGE